METFFGVSQLPRPLKASVVTIGNFDGLHLGHRQIIHRLLAGAKSLGVPSVVFTFDPHPVQVLYPERAMAKLFDLEDLQEQLEGLGVDYLIVQPFSKEFAALEPETFIRQWVVLPCGLKKLLVGYDFGFGSQRSGNLSLLAQLGQEMGFDLEVVSALELDGMAISSSRIRKALAAGEMHLVARLLGRPFSLRGTVQRGEGRGRGIGFPTANLKVTSQSLPQSGVYICRAWLGSQNYPAVTNVGTNPTFSSADKGSAPRLKVESHFWSMGQGQDLYGQQVRLEFLHRLRGEQKFSSAEDLSLAIARDLDQAKSWWQEQGAKPH